MGRLLTRDNNMKKLAFPRLLALSLCCTLLSGASHAAKPDPAYPPQPAMFMVKDGDSTAYIFGSAHKVKRGVAWRTELFDTALARADEVWLEATREAMSNPILGVKVMRAGYNMRDSLSKILSNEEYSALEDAAYGAGVDMSELNHLRPWAASMALQGYAYQSSIDSGKQKKLTLHSGVEEIASGIVVGKPLKSIENVEKHMMLFANLSPQEEKELLMYTVNEINKPVNEEFKARMKLWAAGDLDALHEATNVPMREKTPGLYNLMMTQRNQEMADVISAEMDKAGEDFFIVGAAHLAGPESVVALLEEKGYAVERVYDSKPPVTSNSERKPEAPRYRTTLDLPPYLNIALRPDKNDSSGSVILRFSYPVALNGCFEVSPINFKMIENENVLEISTLGYLTNLHPDPEKTGCGAASKFILIDVPLNIAELREKKIDTLYMFAPGSMDPYKLLIDGDTVTLVGGKSMIYYRPDPNGSMSVKLAKAPEEKT